MSSKLRVYEVARDLGMDNKELATLLQSIGFSEIKNHMSVVPPEAIERAKRQIERRNEPNKGPEERIRPTVVKRRAAVKRPDEPATAAGAESSSAIKAAVPHEESRAAHATHAVALPATETVPTRVAETKATVSSAASAQAVVASPQPVVEPREAEDAGHASAVAVSSDRTPDHPEPLDEARIEPGLAAGGKAGDGRHAEVPQASSTPSTEPVRDESPLRDEAPRAEVVPVELPPKADASEAVDAAAPQADKLASATPVEVAKAEPVTPAEVAKAEPTRIAEAAKAEPPKAVEFVKSEPAKEHVAARDRIAPPPKPEASPVVTPAKHGQPSKADVAQPVKTERHPQPAVAPKGSAAAVSSAPVQATAVSAEGAAKPAAAAARPAPARAATAGASTAEPRPAPAPASVPPPRPSSPPRTGIDVWEGRPGVPMGPAHRAPVPRRVQYDPKAGANAAQRRPGQPGSPGGGQRGPMARGGMRGRGPGMSGPGGGPGRGGPAGGRAPAAAVTTQERGAHKRVVRIESSIGLQTLAGRMGIKAHELLRKLIMLGMTGVNINSTLDADTAKICASEFGWDVEDVAVSEEQALVIAQGVETEVDVGERAPRPPVVTVMGHVDHGKTSLLDRIRKANVVAGEAGGITQHIGAYSVETPAGRITFLDTPGHAAFTAMRARGAQTTDIVILVVAADDGVMPQTKEAVNHAKLAKVPIVVAINKCDKPEAQPDRCRRELSESGLVPEEWGGDTLFTEISAHTGQGIDALLEKVLLQAEMLDLRANPNKPAVGVVLEAQLDRGRGPVATVLITDGTLNRGDVLLAGAATGKVRAMLDSMGRSLGAAGPATPVEVIGLNDVPAAGDPIHVLKDIKKAQEIADSRKTKERRSLMPNAGPRLTLEELYKAMKDAEQLELKVIVKGDVHGSVEAVSDSLVRLSTDKVKVTVVQSAAGAITEGDVNLAVAAGAIIIGFNVRPAGKAASLAAQEKVEIRHYNIIYNVVDDVKAAMEGLLSPSLVEKALGQAQVRQVFRVTKAGNVAGCMVTQGLIRRTGTVRLMRENAVVWSGKLSSLKRFKDDAREVKEGFDCGIALDGYQDIKEGDIIECFEMEEVRQTL